MNLLGCKIKKSSGPLQATLTDFSALKKWNRLVRNYGQNLGSLCLKDYKDNKELEKD